MITKANLPKIINQVEWIDSIIGVIGVMIILGAALFVQFFLHETPCPLCELQRAAFVNIGIALIMNIRYGNKASHWGMVILSASTGAAVSLRQICLHITSPAGFGDAVLGLHMYTWCFIGFSTAIVGSAVMLLIYPERKPTFSC
ncbi:MAG: lidJ [Gammaproteobacteria bacterium]|jgi:disulfide bond formation protein DsbB|nr:lidJ [Gammaproteobacteria bacterium]